MSSKYFIICCLLSVFVAAGSVRGGGKSVDWCALWGSMDGSDRAYYLLGYRDGLHMSAVAADHGKRIIQLGYSDAVMAAAVSDLYGDKRNAGIPVNLMVVVAKDRLDGKDVEWALENYRKMGD